MSEDESLTVSLMETTGTASVPKHTSIKLLRVREAKRRAATPDVAPRTLC